MFHSSWDSRKKENCNEGYGREQTGKMKGKICLSIQIAESCHLFFVVFFFFPLGALNVHDSHSTGATQTVKASVTISRQYLLILF